MLIGAIMCINYGANAETGTNGPTIDAGIGIGIYDKLESTGVAFTQRIGAEWHVARINSNLSFAAGLYLNNSYGSSWAETHLDREWIDLKLTRDDITILPTASLRYSFTSRIEGYFSLGLGLGILHSKGSVDDYESSYYPYELDNSATNTSFSMSTYLGIRYFFSKNWAVNAQAGMIAGNLKKHATSFNLLSVGVSYRF